MLFGAARPTVDFSLPLSCFLAFCFSDSRMFDRAGDGGPCCKEECGNNRLNVLHMWLWGLVPIDRIGQFNSIPMIEGASGSCPTNSPHHT